MDSGSVSGAIDGQVDRLVTPLSITASTDGNVGEVSTTLVDRIGDPRVFEGLLGVMCSYDEQ